MKFSSADDRGSRSTIAAVVAVCAAVLAAAALSASFGGSARDGDDSPQASVPRAAAEPTLDEDLSIPAELEEGDAAADDEAAEATTAIEPDVTHTQVGAIQAFVSYATWAIASPAAAADPAHADEALGGELNAADAAMVEGIDRSSDLDYQPSQGAYRILAIAGNEDQPDQVMLEVLAPMTVHGQVTWSSLGGVMTWMQGAWVPTTMRPSQDTPVQPSDPSMSLIEMTEDDRSLLLDGLGWQLFSNSTDTDG